MTCKNQYIAKKLMQRITKGQSLSFTSFIVVTNYLLLNT